jgi:tetratricopeptide (TPR) repeat protein
MKSIHLNPSDIQTRYSTALDALGEIAQHYFFAGRLVDAQQVIRAALAVAEVRDVQPEQRLKLLLLYANILVVDHLLSRTDGVEMFTIIEQAQTAAEALQDEQGIADALSLLGQAHYFATMTANMPAILASLNSSEPLEQSLREKFNESLADQERAFERRKALHDTRGMSESHFFIGLIYERWKQPDTALEHYRQAREIAQQNGHVLAQAEPSRHMALAAVLKGDWDGALPYALDALAFREVADFMPYQPLDHLLLRDIYMAQDDAAKIAYHAERVSTLAQAIGHGQMFADMLKRSLFKPKIQTES